MSATQKPTAEPKFRVVRTLGKGAFGKVLLIRKTENGNSLVAKKIPVQDENRNQAVKKEYQIQENLSKTGNPHVVKTIAMRTESKFLYIFLEYVDGGNLAKKIKPNFGMKPEQAKHYFRQILDGLQFIHGNGYVHRDIKPDNLLLTKKDTIKISDFGFARLYRAADGMESLLSDKVGTRDYKAPELFKKEKYRGPPIDVWSSGITLVTLLTGVFPWDCAERTDQSYNKWSSESELDELPWNKMDQVTIDFFKEILTDEPEKRATVEQIKSHPWLEVKKQTPTAVKEKNLRRKENHSNSEVPESDVQPISNAKRQKL
ncbi:unnamed protein product [Caenorhabditis brenneri]